MEWLSLSRIFSLFQNDHTIESSFVLVHSLNELTAIEIVQLNSIEFKLILAFCFESVAACIRVFVYECV